MLERSREHFLLPRTQKKALQSTSCKAFFVVAQV